MINREEIKYILENAILAPSMLNTQSWRFRAENGKIAVYANIESSLIFCDPNLRNLYLSVGAVIENVILTAQYLGYRAQINYFPQKYNHDFIAELEFSEDDQTSHQDPLYDHIHLRKTNRKRYSPRIVLPEERTTIKNCFHNEGEQELLFRDNASLKRALLIADRLRFSNSELVSEFIETLRSRHKRIGLEASHLEQGWGQTLLFNPIVKLWIRSGCLGSEVVVPLYYTKGHLQNTSTVGWFLTEDITNLGVVKAGRAMQRILLCATSLNIHTHVINFPLLYLERMDFDFTNRELAATEQLKDIFKKEFPSESQHIVFIFRLGYAKRSNRKTARQPLERFLIHNDPLGM